MSLTFCKRVSLVFALKQGHILWSMWHVKFEWKLRNLLTVGHGIPYAVIIRHRLLCGIKCLLKVKKVDKLNDHFPRHGSFLMKTFLS